MQEDGRIADIEAEELAAIVTVRLTSPGSWMRKGSKNESK
jgi:hypothetical protein